MISDDVLSEIRERLVSRFHPDKIILFGSQARGTADKRSDIDLLVICRFKEKRRRLMVEMDRELSKLDYAFDVVILTPDEFERDRDIPGTIGRYASKEGNVFYAQPKSDQIDGTR
jgi:predicted nucleotidyltransferase